MTAYTTGGAIQLASVSREGGGFGALQLVNTFLVHPETYPPTHEIPVLQPDGATFEQLFTQERSIVISQNLATQQAIQIGDTLRVARTDEPFTVTGIVATEAEAGITSIFSAFFRLCLPGFRHGSGCY